MRKFYLSSHNMNDPHKYTEVQGLAYCPRCNKLCKAGIVYNNCGNAGPIADSIEVDELYPCAIAQECLENNPNRRLCND
jgi:hypothetical protein